MPININSPLPSSLASESRKAARILNSFRDNGKGVDSMIDPHILSDAKGLAIFTVLKAGFLFSGRAGSGLVIARLPDGSWSAPSAIMTGGVGFGGQVGAELTDFIMVLNTSAAVKTFMHTGSITLGGNISVAAGPIGRNAEASGTASIKNVSAVYSYSKTRGLFAGVSLEGSVIVERSDANKKLYGRKVKCTELLSGHVPPPQGAEELYRALDIKTNFSSGRGEFGAQQTRRTSTRSSDTQSSDVRPGFDHQNTNTSSRTKSYSRAAIHKSAKYGGSLMTAEEHYKGQRVKGEDNIAWKSDSIDTPKQITAQPSYSFNDNFAENKSLVVSNYNDLRARALHNFTGEQSGDLPFRKGDIITIVQKTNTQNDWWTGKSNGKEGIFPANFVEIM